MPGWIIYGSGVTVAVHRLFNDESRGVNAPANKCVYAFVLVKIFLRYL